MNFTKKTYFYKRPHYITMNNLTFFFSLVLTLLTSSLIAQNFIHTKKLTSSIAGPDDVFGGDLSISGDLAVVGAKGGSANEQEAFIYRRNLGGLSQWGEVAILRANIGNFASCFGSDVAIDGETVVVGASCISSIGSVFVFMKDAGGIDNWGEVAMLSPSDGANGDAFGISVAISGDVVVVGSWQDDDAGSRSGSAYIFSRNVGGPNQWGQVAKLTASDAAAKDIFGESVAISNDVVIVGAFGNDDGGSAYIFSKDTGGPNQWGEVTKLVSSDIAPDDDFGTDVSICGDVAMVGASRADTPFSSIGGSVYVFNKDAGGLNQWGETAKLTASNSRNLGTSVDLDGTTAVFGAVQSNPNGPSITGNAYIFTNVPAGSNQWVQLQEIYAFDGANGDEFGIDVAVSGDVVFVGSQRDNDHGNMSGSVYIYERPTCPISYSIANNNRLSGNQIFDAHYMTDGIIESNQLISNNAQVDYDSRNSIELLQTFEVTMGVMFHAFIDGCTP